MRAGSAPYPPPLKRFGQHFLTDDRVVERIADALEITPQDTVVEIGAGRGVLTDRLVQRAGRVAAVEVDRALSAFLRERYAGRDNVQVIEQDVLRLKLGDVAAGEYLLAGNVPYYITTPILFHTLVAPTPRRAVFLVQREVAERAVAPPGGKTYGALSVNLQAAARVEYLFDVAPGAFRPPPRVDSAVIRVTPVDTPLVSASQRDTFQRFVQAVFAFRRKQMIRVLRTVLGAAPGDVDALLRGVAVDAAARPETISPAGFVELFDRCVSLGWPGGH